MCSIRKTQEWLGRAALTLAAAGSVMAMLGGCQANVPAGVEPVQNKPLIIDEAMQRREWDRSVAYYPNGDTVAGGTGYMFQTHETIPDGWRRVADPLVSVMNIGLLPVGIFVNSPFS